MRILLAPDKFKSSLSAADVARAMLAGIRQVDPTIAIDICPVADGGEGTVAALVTATNGQFVTRRVTGPLAEMKVDAAFGMLGDVALPDHVSEHQPPTAVIEMSAASGLHLLALSDRNPLATTTFGTGELIQAAVELGAKRIILGIGGSATCDAGVGCLQACGCHVILRDGKYATESEPLCGRDLDDIAIVKSHRGSPVDGIEIVIASDVTNPLYGPSGAAHVFAPQKGASPEDVAELDRMLREFALRLDKADLAAQPGSGAGGGLGFGMAALFNASVRSGAAIVLDAVRFADRLETATVCLTGEGQLDGQSADGKIVSAIAKACAAANIPCVVIAGSIGDGAERILERGATAYFGICDHPMSLQESIDNASTLIASSAGNVTRLLRVLHPG